MLIGIDVGTTTVKAALFDSKGNVQKSFNERYPTSRPTAGHVQQNPSDWMRLILASLKFLSEGTTLGAIQAIGLCSQVNTHVFVDEAGNALMPAITWQDGRCADEALKLDTQISSSDKLAWWRVPLPIDASHVLARMAYIQKYHADVWRKTRWVMAPKDYCLMQLSGAIAADPMTNFGIIDGSLGKIASLIDLVPGAEKRLPPLFGFTEKIGKVRDGLPCAGTSLVTGAMDAWAGMLGAGVCDEGQCVYLGGTSEILGIISSQKAPTQGVVAFPKCEGITLHAGPTQSGGASVEWLSRLLGRTAAEISMLASLADMTKPLPLFLPHLDGERAPLWDIKARASFCGITSSTGPSEFSRSVLEGVGYSARLVLDALEKSACSKPEIINHSGGGSSSDIWCQIRANILGRPIQRTRVRESGVLGAAMIAGVGAGSFPSLRNAALEFVQMDNLFNPDSSETERHINSYGLYQSLYHKLIAHNAALSAS